MILWRENMHNSLILFKLKQYGIWRKKCNLPAGDGLGIPWLGVILEWDRAQLVKM